MPPGGSTMQWVQRQVCGAVVSCFCNESSADSLVLHWNKCCKTSLLLYYGKFNLYLCTAVCCMLISQHYGTQTCWTNLDFYVHSVLYLELLSTWQCIVSEITVTEHFMFRLTSQNLCSSCAILVLHHMSLRWTSLRTSSADSTVLLKSVSSWTLFSVSITVIWFDWL